MNVTMDMNNFKFSSLNLKTVASPTDRPNDGYDHLEAGIKNFFTLYIVVISL